MEFGNNNQSNINQPLDQSNQRSKKSYAGPIITILMVVIINVIGFYTFKYVKNMPPSTSSKQGFKTIAGCVQPLGTNIKINFNMDIPQNYNIYNPPGAAMGCGGGQYSNEVGYRMPGGLNTITVSAYIAAGSSQVPESMQSTTARFSIPSPNDKYAISVDRDSTTSPTNDQWDQITKSFKLK